MYTSYQKYQIFGRARSCFNHSQLNNSLLSRSWFGLAVAHFGEIDILSWNTHFLYAFAEKEIK